MKYKSGFVRFPSLNLQIGYIALMVIESSHCNSSEDGVTVDFIYKYPIF